MVSPDCLSDLDTIKIYGKQRFELFLLIDVSEVLLQGTCVVSRILR